MTGCKIKVSRHGYVYFFLKTYSVVDKFFIFNSRSTDKEKQQFWKYNRKIFHLLKPRKMSGNQSIFVDKLKSCNLEQMINDFLTCKMENVIVTCSGQLWWFKLYWKFLLNKEDLKYYITRLHATLVRECPHFLDN